jgi:hypothetical protein
MRIVGILLLTGIFFSYLPMAPMDDCSEGDHVGNVRTDCGYCPLCPVLISMDVPGHYSLPFAGRLNVPASLSKVDELSFPVFHPPKFLI